MILRNSQLVSFIFYRIYPYLLVAIISREGIRTETCEYGTVTRSLTELKDWLLDKEVTQGIKHAK